METQAPVIRSKGPNCRHVDTQLAPTPPRTYLRTYFTLPSRRRLGTERVGDFYADEMGFVTRDTRQFLILLAIIGLSVAAGCWWGAHDGHWTTPAFEHCAAPVKCYTDKPELCPPKPHARARVHPNFRGPIKPFGPNYDPHRKADPYTDTCRWERFFGTNTCQKET